MRELEATYLKLFRAVLTLTGLQFWVMGIALAGQPVVKQIRVLDHPLSFELDVTGKAPVKVIRISSKEVLIAMKNVSLAKGFSIQGKENAAVASIHVERLDGNVVAVVITAKKPLGKIDSAFNKSHTRFKLSVASATLPSKSGTPGAKTAKPVPAATPAPKTPAAKAEPEKTPEAVSKQTATTTEPTVQPKADLPRPTGSKPGEEPRKLASAPASPPVYVPPKRAKTEYRGDISDIHRGTNAVECEAKEVQNALLLMKKELYQRAYETLDQYILKENFSCLETVYFLKAFSYYKGISDQDPALLLKAERFFQDALVSYPKSQYLPFAYTALGLIQYRLKNMSAAEGYFNIVSQGYKDYTGMPEVQYHLAGIYDSKGYTDKALNLYEKVFKSPLDNSYITDAGVGYGKALYAKRQYFNALSVFNYVIENDVKKVYDSPDLLRYTADADFELGLSREARQNYTRLSNLFPDIPDRDMVLSKVGDAYGMENQKEKAVKIYELVREKFPDTPGFINASIGIARYLETDPEKIEIYEMIKKRFPDNSYARIAMMRLAEIYQKNGEYNKCIKEVEDLLSTHPRGLRYEAVKLMQKAYEALFRKELKADEYTSVLDRYEREHDKIDRMGSRLIAFRVGTAYLKARLYEEAFNHLLTAYKQFKRPERTPELLFGLGKAMDESGRDEDALKLYTAFVRRFPKDGQRITAFLSIGRIYLEKEKYDRAKGALSKALAVAASPMDRGRVLMLHANVFEAEKDLKQAAGMRERAIKAFAEAPGQHYDLLADAYKTLGNTYLSLRNFVPAADAFEKALRFSEGERAKANIGFLLGDAYQKGNVLDKAKAAFEQVASYDSVWARMARQRLSTLSLAEKMINS